MPLRGSRSTGIGGKRGEIRSDSIKVESRFKKGDKIQQDILITRGCLLSN